MTDIYTIYSINMQEYCGKQALLWIYLNFVISCLILLKDFSLKSKEIKIDW